MGSEYDSAVDSARKFPLVGSESLRSEFTNPATGRLGLNTGAGYPTAQAGFGSPTPARPPLRSVLDGYTGRAGAFDTRTPNRYSASETGGSHAHQDGSEVDERARNGRDRITSPVLTLAPYTPAGGVLVRPLSSAVSCYTTQLFTELFDSNHPQPLRQLLGPYCSALPRFCAFVLPFPLQYLFSLTLREFTTSFNSFAGGCLELLGGGVRLLSQCDGARVRAAAVSFVWRHPGPRGDPGQLAVH
jgi:hypothetical protein